MIFNTYEEAEAVTKLAGQKLQAQRRQAHFEETGMESAYVCEQVSGVIESDGKFTLPDIDLHIQAAQELCIEFTI